MSTTHPPVFIKIARRRWQRPGYEFAGRYMRTAYCHRKWLWLHEERAKQRQADRIAKQKHYAMLAKRGQEARARREEVQLLGYKKRNSSGCAAFLFVPLGLVACGLAVLSPLLGAPMLLLTIVVYAVTADGR